MIFLIFSSDTLCLIYLGPPVKYMYIVYIIHAYTRIYKNMRVCMYYMIDILYIYILIKCVF